jgi:hypothetical protein
MCSGPSSSKRRRPSPSSTGTRWISISSSPQQRLGGAGPVHQHGPIARRGPGQLRALLDVGDEPGAARRDVALVDVPGEDEDRHAVVVVALPPPGELERAPAGDHGPGRQCLAEDLTVRAVGHPVVEPVEQPPAVATELLAGTVVGSGDEAVERHGHVQHQCGHGALAITRSRTMSSASAGR